MKGLRVGILGLFLACSAVVGVQAQGVAGSLNVGTMGPGVGVNVGLTRQFNVRIAGHLLPLSRTGDYVDEDNDVTIAYDADVQLGGASVLADWHPTGGSFRLTVGAFYNNNNASFSGRPTTPYKFDDNKTFAPEKLGSLAGEFKYPAISPYLGLGFGNALNRRVSFLVDLGVLYTGSPEITITGEGMIAPTANWAPTINEGLESFQWFPYLSFGVGYRFTGADR